MRLFIGIPLAAGVIEELTALTERLKSASDGMRWSAPAGWHITLQFLGKTSAEQYACLVPALRQVPFSPFAIQLEPPGFFERAGVFFAGVKLSSELIRLQELVVAATGRCGFVPEDRPYHPHITLAVPEKSFGGHLEPGTTVFTFAVVTLGVLPDNIDFTKLDDKSYR